jgi:hypothetical protein
MTTPISPPPNGTRAVPSTPARRSGTATAGHAPVQSYAPPRLIRLGTLAELTHGGNVSAQSDGIGFAGGSGVI